MTKLRDQLRLVVVTDRKKAAKPLAEVVAAALRGGATAVQLREKDLGARELMALARRIRELTAAEGALLIVNDRVDVALAVGADGVQLGWTSLTVSDVRRIAGPALIVGASTHDVAEVADAERGGADFVTFGPVFDTPSKRGILAKRGCRGLAAAVKSTALPVVALGGIRVERVADVRAAGACGVASVSRIMSSRDPEQRTRLFAEAWDAAGNSTESTVRSG
ncbi:MAG: thiamine phosphate synthase [Planctomycetes bacterium]|nr:thiamine phosphate synthase [Planctomycetota bacterium]